MILIPGTYPEKCGAIRKSREKRESLLDPLVIDFLLFSLYQGPDISLIRQYPLYGNGQGP